ncbi:MAG: RNA-binding component of cleavage and polyadenylation factor [Cyphobasidiales sp. Tagirdzhanova-0007]|nr:MAG: RNA-binding component of cleavage and polyadenylation factor [Cyphobasidiales sp. Tagirdzhanova-0007]
MSVVTPSLPSWAVPDIVAFPSFAHTELLLEQRIKIEVSPAIKLDADAQICRAHLTPSGCSEGHLCPKRHTNPSSLNYAPPPVHTSSHSKTVCKHWLRGLCKKGLDCEFLHEYNLRKMPECWFFTKHGFCSSGDECMYLHITPHQRRPECRSYTAGFCRAEGLECKHAHPSFIASEVERLCTRSHERMGELYRNRDRDWPGDSGGGYANHGGLNLAERGDAVSGDVVMDGGSGGRRPLPGRILKGITCFKCTQMGHLASQCPNPSVPGNRGGLERGPGGRALERSHLLE